MNEDGTPTISEEPIAPDINSEEGGVTASDVASVLHLAKPAETTEVPKTPETAPVEETPAVETPPVEEPVSPTPLVTPVAPAIEELPETPSFSVEIEDANGNKFNIGSLQDLPRDFEPKDNVQVMEILQQLQDLKNEKTSWESKRVETEQAAEKAQLVTNIQAGWDKEIATLQGEKRLPIGSDGKSTERTNQVFKFMSEENNRRAANGIPLIQSFGDALDKIELVERREADKKAEVDAKELARKNGGLIGGSSAPATAGKPTYKAGTAKNANQALRTMGLL